MKIGILTFHNADNYGAVLQCYALQETLKELRPNDEVCVIDYRNPCIEQDHKIVRNVINSNRNIIVNLASLFCQLLYIFQTKRKIKKFKSFRKNYMCLNRGIFKDFDLIIYGSDQIWNLNLTGKDITYFGDNYNGRKIAYAASDGGELIINNEINKLFSSFCKISCRENTLTNKLIACGYTVANVCDPVFLLSIINWKKIMVPIKRQNYVLIYQVIENKDMECKVREFSLNNNCALVEILYIKTIKKFFHKGIDFEVGISPNEFISYIYNAQYVFTTSFHATAFSILFKKNFYTFSIHKRSERITNLLSALGMSDRYGNEIPEDMNIGYNENIKKKLNDYILNSKNFLEEFIK